MNDFYFRCLCNLLRKRTSMGRGGEYSQTNHFAIQFELIFKDKLVYILVSQVVPVNPGGHLHV